MGAVAPHHRGMAITNLRIHRQEANLSQNQLAEASGISRVTIVKAENGQTMMRMPTRRRLAQALGAELRWNESEIESHAKALMNWAEPPEIDPRTPVNKAADQMADIVESTLHAREVARESEREGRAFKRLAPGYRNVENPQAVLDDMAHFATMVRVAVFAAAPAYAWSAHYESTQQPRADFTALSEHTGLDQTLLAVLMADADVLIDEGRVPLKAIAVCLRHLDAEDEALLDAVCRLYPQDDRPTSALAKNWVQDLRQCAWRLWQAYCPGTMPTANHPEVFDAESILEVADKAPSGLADRPSIRRKIHPSDHHWTNEYLSSLSGGAGAAAFELSSFQKQRLGPAAGNIVHHYGVDAYGNAFAEIENPTQAGERIIEVLWPHGIGSPIEVLPGDHIVAEQGQETLFMALVRDGRIVALIPRAHELEGGLGYPGGAVAPARDLRAALEANGIDASLAEIERILTLDDRAVTIDVDTLR